LDVEIWLRLAVIVLLLALSAFFSSVESAYFSLSRAVLDRLRDLSDPRARRVVRLMDDPRRLLSTILTGNTVVNTAAAAIAALLAADLAIEWGFSPNIAVAAEVLIVTVLILVVSEVTPKLLALRDPERWALSSSAAVKVARQMLSPLAVPLAWVTGYLSQAFGIERHSTLAMSEEEIRALIQVGHEHGALEIEEREMIHSIFEFGDTTTREVMVPRIDMVVVEKGVSLDELLKTVASRGHSRIPVYDEKVDNIIGLIYAKDLLKVGAHGGAPDMFDLMSLLRPAYFIPEEKKIDDLLREFQAEKIHMAIVVDEYGGTAGLVTMEDIIEEIVGEIQDEYDREQPLSRRLDDKTILASGRIGISDLNEQLGFELIPDSDAYDTLAGFIYSQLAEVPHKGQEFEFQGYRFNIEEVLGKRISRVRVTHEEGLFEDV